MSLHLIPLSCSKYVEAVDGVVVVVVVGTVLVDVAGQSYSRSSKDTTELSWRMAKQVCCVVLRCGVVCCVMWCCVVRCCGCVVVELCCVVLCCVVLCCMVV